MGTGVPYAQYSEAPSPLLRLAFISRQKVAKSCCI
jgi:hypothetical protein